MDTHVGLDQHLLVRIYTCGEETRVASEPIGQIAAADEKR
jgi:hypothetical protein